MDIYREHLLDHYTHPRNSGTLPHPTHTGAYDNPLCGDRIQATLVVENGIIQQIKFQSSGCAVAVATASLLSEKIQHQKLAKIKQLSLEDLLDLLGTSLTSSRQQCALAPLKALKSALNLK